MTDSLIQNTDPSVEITGIIVGGIVMIVLFLVMGGAININIGKHRREED